MERRLTEDEKDEARELAEQAKFLPFHRIVPRLLSEIARLERDVRLASQRGR